MAKLLKGATAVETHSAILDLIRSSGVVSRIELSDRSGLTGASISRIVKTLLNAGLIAETGLGDATGGKRRTLLQLNARSRHAVGVLLDAVMITYVLIDLNGEVISRRDADGIGAASPGEVIARVATELADVIGSAGIDRESLLGIGLAVAGRQDSDHHVLRSNPEATEWELFDIEQTLSSATDLPVVIENDSTCAAIGEYWVGRIPAAADFATVYMATGFGLGLVTQGDVYRGSSSNVGEIGHMVLDLDGPACWCGSRGCLEMLAAPRRVVELALATPGFAAELGLQGQETTVRQDFALITTAAAADHEVAAALVEHSAGYLATALVSVTNLLDLDQIILAGPAFGAAGELYVRRVWQELERLSFVRTIHPTKVGLSRSSEISAALGAATLVLHSRLTPHQTSSRLGRSPAAGQTGRNGKGRPEA